MGPAMCRPHGRLFVSYWRVGVCWLDRIYWPLVTRLVWSVGIRAEVAKEKCHYLIERVSTFEKYVVVSVDDRQWHDPKYIAINSGRSKSVS